MGKQSGRKGEYDPSCARHGSSPSFLGLINEKETAVSNISCLSLSALLNTLNESKGKDIMNGYNLKH